MSYDVSLEWIGVDFDGTLATYYGWDDPRNGEPIPAMVKRVQDWLAEGKEVRIVTARVADTRLEHEQQRDLVQNWCIKHLGVRLKVTCVKDMYMKALWDDRAVKVVHNQGLDATEEAEMKLACAEDRIGELEGIVGALEGEISALNADRA